MNHEKLQASPVAPGLVPDHRILEVKSPLVGTFRLNRVTDAGPSVRPGDNVVEKSVLCDIQVLNETYQLKAFTRGYILEILPRDGEPVEYGEVLFRIVLQ